MRIAVTGATGFVGSALIPLLTRDGHQVKPLTRAQLTATPFDPTPLADIDVLVHLAGENIAQRWTSGARRRILDSRVESGRRLAQALARMPRPPRAIVSASAVGYYGDRGDELLDEGSAPGSGFLAEVCHAWEEATAPAQAAGIRTVHLRFGIILSPRGGSLVKLLPLFRMGLGGKLGTGKQWTSWIALTDAVNVLRFAITRTTLAGPVNATSAHPVTNAEFSATLASVLHRPNVFTVPAFALRLVFGDMADEVLLSGQRVYPSALERARFHFQYPHLADALLGELSH